jgi:hypothetical protein
MDTSIFLGLPHYGELVPEAIISLIQPTNRHRLKIQTNCASLLAHNFNRLWCAALNQRRELGLTHFAMHHADVAANAGWLDLLVEEMARVGADVLSCVIPLKDNRGLTSTALQDPKTLAIRRLTMKEIKQELPVTFNASHFSGVSEPILLVNTGLWICDFTRSWVEEFPGFTILDGIARQADGTFKTSVFSEDWHFSEWCARKGLQVFATSIVPVTHWGRALFRNDSPWGEWDTDKGDS